MDDVLTGWQSISDYLRVSQKTAMRYKKNLKLPVCYNSDGRVTTTRQALDSWRFGEAMPEYYPKDDR
jgi:hypothetical protein